MRTDGWKPFNYYDKRNTAPPEDTLVFIREDYYNDGVTLGFFDGFTMRTWTGSDDCHVSWWKEIEMPADPGKRDE